MEIGVCLKHCVCLLPAHRKCLAACAGDHLSGSEFGEDGTQIIKRATYPLQLSLRKPLLLEAHSNLVVGKDTAVVACGGFVQLDAVVPNGSGFELLCNTLLHATRCLADLQQSLMVAVIDAIRVNARVGLWLRRENLANRMLTHMLSS